MKMVRVFKTKSNIEAMGIENLYNQNDIPCRIINKMDSAYAHSFGEIEIYVEKTYVIKAKYLLKNYLNQSIDD